MNRLLTSLALALALLHCTVPPKTVTPPDACLGLPDLTLSLLPTKVRVQQPSKVTVNGGDARYRVSVAPAGSGGELRGELFVAGPTPAQDTLTVVDGCGHMAQATLDVIAAFDVLPTRATVKPGTTFQISTAGMLGSPVFTGTALPSGGSVTGSGHYTAGASEGLDLITVQDSTSGDEALLQFKVAKGARFLSTPERWALPSGASVTLRTVDGSGVVTWAKVSGPGTLAGNVFSASASDVGTAVLEATDTFTQEKVRATATVLSEVRRTGRPHGRLTDFATLATGDFDGDGLVDLAVGVPESDLKRPQGGAVFIFKGQTAGFPSAPTWTLTGDTDTAQLGAVLAAGDLNGDGKADLAISSPGADVTISDSGAVLLYTFTDKGPVLLREPLTGLGRASFGTALVIADVDGDGDDDLVVGSPNSDLAPAPGINTRGVVDVFLLTKGQPIPDLGTVRLGGVDLNADGTTSARASLRFGKALVVADLNTDGRTDIAGLSTVNNVLVNGVAQARAQYAVQVHLGRAGSPAFAGSPDLYVVPSNSADTQEGTVYLALAPAVAGRKPMLTVLPDRADAPLPDGGTGVNANAGAAFFFDLSNQTAASTPPSKPVQVGLSSAFARIYGDAANIFAGRSWAFTDLNADGAMDFVVGAPGAQVGGLLMSGKLSVYPFAGLSAGAVVIKPLDTRGGANRSDVLGVALSTLPLGNQTALVSVAARATTAQGDFTGRLDIFSLAGTSLATWSREAVAFPAKLAAEQFGASVDVGVMAGKVQTLVGVPGYAGPGPNGDGNDLGAGQAVVASGTTSQLLHEGSASQFLTDAGQSVWGGRLVGTGVAFTDFDGDGRLDAVNTAPGFTTPGNGTTEYALNRPECLPAPRQTVGGVVVHFGRADGTFKDGLRLWGTSFVAGCADAGIAACVRVNSGRYGVAGGFDFNKDGKQDLLVTRSWGADVFLGRAPDDASLSKPSMGCDVAHAAVLPGNITSAPAALGDIDGDGCHDVALRYLDNGGTRIGVAVLYGFDPGGACGPAHLQPSMVRLAADPEVGLANWQLGISIARAGKVLGDSRDFLAVTANAYPFQGLPQATILLVPTAELNAKRVPGSSTVASALGDGITTTALVYETRALGLGASLAGNVDLSGDGIPDLVASAPQASVNGDATGAVFIFKGGAQLSGARPAWWTIAADGNERASFGVDLGLSRAVGATPPQLVIGAPLSYRSGTANGTVFVLPLAP